MEALLERIAHLEDPQEIVSVIQQLGGFAREESQRTVLREKRDRLAPIVNRLQQSERRITPHAERPWRDGVNVKIMRLLTNLAYESVESANWIIEQSEDESNEEDIVRRVTELYLHPLAELSNNDDIALMLECRRNALALITNLSNENDDVKKRCVKHGTVERILQLIKERSTEEHRGEDDDLGTLYHALSALRNVISKDGDIAKHIADLHGVETLCALISAPETAMNYKSIAIRGSLLMLCSIRDNAEHIRSLNVIELMMETINNCMQLKTVEVDDDDGDDEREERDELMTDAISVLHILVMSDVGHAKRVAQVGASRLMIDIMRWSVSTMVRDSAMEVLGAMAQLDDFHAHLLECNILPTIVEHARTEAASRTEYNSNKHPNTFLRTVIKIVGLLALKDESLDAFVRDGVLDDIIIPLLDHTQDVNIQRNACIALGNMARTDSNCREIVQRGVVSKLCEVLNREPPQDAEPAPEFVTQLNVGDMNLKINVAFVLNNLCKSSNKASIMKQIQNFPDLFNQLMREDQPEALQIFSVECIANLSNENEENAKQFAETELDSMIGVLKRHKDKPNVGFYVLKGLVFIKEAAKDDNDSCASIRHALLSLKEDSILETAQESIQKLRTELQEKLGSLEQNESVKQKLQAQMDIMHRISAMLVHALE